MARIPRWSEAASTFGGRGVNSCCTSPPERTSPARDRTDLTSKMRARRHQAGPGLTMSDRDAGEPGAFAEDAVLAAFGDCDRTSVGSFRAVFDAVVRGVLLPRASCRSRTSSTARSARTTTCSSSTTWPSVGEIVVPVRLCLAALPGQRLEDVERVYSHIQALGQAEAFLRAHPWQLLSTYNTAGAGKAIAEKRRARGGRRPLPACRRAVRPRGGWPTRSATCRTTGPASWSWHVRAG